MKYFVLLFLLAIAVATTSSAAISSVVPKVDAQVRTDPGAMSNNGRVRRSPDGFVVTDIPKATSKRGDFHTTTVKNDSEGAMALFLKFIKDLSPQNEFRYADLE